MDFDATLKALGQRSIEWIIEHKRDLQIILKNDPPFFPLSTICYDPKHTKLSKKLLIANMLSRHLSTCEYIFPVNWINGRVDRLQRCVNYGLMLNRKTVRKFAKREWTKILCFIVNKLRRSPPTHGWLRDADLAWFVDFEDCGMREVGYAEQNRHAKHKVKEIIDQYYHKARQRICSVYFALMFDCSYPILHALNTCSAKIWKVY